MTAQSQEAFEKFWAEIPDKNRLPAQRFTFECGWDAAVAQSVVDYQMVRDAYDRALEKLVMARTFMTMEAQRAFDEEWARYMYKLTGKLTG